MATKLDTTGHNKINFSILPAVIQNGGKWFVKVWSNTTTVIYNDGKCFEGSKTTTQSNDGV